MGQRTWHPPGVAGFAHGVGGTLLAQQTADEWRADAAKRSRHKARENFKAHKPARIGEGGVAGEKLVAAEAGERDLQADLARGPGNEVSVESVHRGLIEGADGFVEAGEHVRALLREFGMVFAGVFCAAASEACFLIPRVSSTECVE